MEHSRGSPNITQARIYLEAKESENFDLEWKGFKCAEHECPLLPRPVLATIHIASYSPTSLLPIQGRLWWHNQVHGVTELPSLTPWAWVSLLQLKSQALTPGLGNLKPQWSSSVLQQLLCRLHQSQDFTYSKYYTIVVLQDVTFTIIYDYIHTPICRHTCFHFAFTQMYIYVVIIPLRQQHASRANVT